MPDWYPGMTRSWYLACKKADEDYAKLAFLPKPVRPIVAESTKQAAEYLVQTKDSPRMKKWLSEHTLKEIEWLKNNVRGLKDLS